MPISLGSSFSRRCPDPEGGFGVPCRGKTSTFAEWIAGPFRNGEHVRFRALDVFLLFILSVEDDPQSGHELIFRQLSLYVQSFLHME